MTELKSLVTISSEVDADLYALLAGIGKRSRAERIRRLAMLGLLAERGFLNSSGAQPGTTNVPVTATPLAVVPKEDEPEIETVEGDNGQQDLEKAFGGFGSGSFMV